MTAMTVSQVKTEVEDENLDEVETDNSIIESDVLFSSIATNSGEHGGLRITPAKIEIGHENAEEIETDNSDSGSDVSVSIVATKSGKSNSLITRQIKSEIEEENPDEMETDNSVVESDISYSIAPTKSGFAESPMQEVESLESIIFLRISTEKKQPIKLLRMKALSNFTSEGSQMLGLRPGTVVCLKSENGCDIDNEDGLLYCAQKDLIVIFQYCESNNLLHQAANDSGPSQFRLKFNGCAPKPSPASGPVGWPANYVLPKIPDVVTGHIWSCTNKEEASVLKCSTSFCNAFLKPIVDDVLQFNGEEYYLTTSQFQAIGKAIEREFPVLMDRDGSWEVLKQKLCRKLQYKRTKVTTEKVRKMRERYAPKSKRKKLTDKPREAEIKISANTSSHSDEEIQSLTENGLLSKREDFKITTGCKRPAQYLRNSANLWDVAKATDEATKSLLRKTFIDRKDRSMTQDVAEEILECPPLLHSEYVLFEASLVIRSCCKYPSSCYVLPPYNIEQMDAWITVMSQRLVHADSALRPALSSHQATENKFAANCETMKVWRGFLSVIVRLKESVSAFFDDGGEVVRISGSPSMPENEVVINGCRLHTAGRCETICVFIASFLAFNLSYSKRQEGTIEALEGLIGLRRSFSRSAARNLLKSLNVF